MNRMIEISWKSDPFPYLIIDNYLIESEYDDLINELNSTNPEVQTTFSTALEDKQIYRHTSLKSLSKRLVSNLLTHSLTVSDSPLTKSVISLCTNISSEERSR